MHTRFGAARGFCALAVPLLMLGPLAAAGPAAAAAPACQGWAGIPPLNPGTTANALNGVAVISGCDVWAVGSFDSAGPAQTLIEHWNGSAWKVLPSPDPSSDDFNSLASVQAASPTDIWAVGSYGDGGGGWKTLIVHWNGTRWAQVPSPSGPFRSELTGVRVVSRNDAWAVGDAYDGFAQGTTILRWNGISWRGVASPSPTQADELVAVSALSGRDAWAVGGGLNGTIIEHWNGSKWTQVASPSPGRQVASPTFHFHDELTGVAAASLANAWAVGSYDRGNTKQTLIVHWNGRRWMRVPSPDPGGTAHDNTLTAVTVTAGSAWAVGSYTTGTVTKTLILHWNGTAWTQVTSPDPGTANQLTAVRALSATSAWAVGSFSAGTTPSQTLAVRCCC